MIYFHSSLVLVILLRFCHFCNKNVEKMLSTFGFFYGFSQVYNNYPAANTLQVWGQWGDSVTF